MRVSAKNRGQRRPGGKIILTIFALACLFVSTGAAQQKPATKRSLKARLPRVGVIKDYPATGMQTGCSNFYFVFPQKPKPLEERYVFLAHSDGDAWMNLDGRDTHLTYLRTKITRPNTARTRWLYFYRAGRILITVSIINNPRYRSDDDYPYSMTITLRRGRAVRRVKAVGSADC